MAAKVTQFLNLVSLLKFQKFYIKGFFLGTDKNICFLLTCDYDKKNWQETSKGQNFPRCQNILQKSPFVGY